MGMQTIPCTFVGGAIYEITIFESIAASPGTVTLPTGASIRLNAWSAGVDALVSTITGGRPDFRNAVDAGGNAVTTTLDAAGNYALSAAPTAYPVAIIYVVRVTLENYTLWDATELDQIIDIIGLHDLPTPTAGDVVYANAEPRWESLVHPGGAEYVIESTGASVQWGATTADGETTPSTVLRANSNGRLRLARIGLGTSPSYPLHVNGDYTFGTSMYPAVIQGQGTDDVAPAILFLVQNDEGGGSGYSAEVHVRLDATSRARRYFNFAIGGTDDWLTGANGSDPADWILYNADGDYPCHRFLAFSESYTAVNAVDTAAVRINYHITDAVTGTGGLEVYTGGGADPDLWWIMANGLRQYDGAGNPTDTTIDAIGCLGVQSVTINQRYGITCNPAHTVVNGASQGGVNTQPSYTPASNSTSGVIGVYSQPSSAGSADIAYVAGVSGIAICGSSGTLTTLYGLQFYARATAGGVTNVYGMWTKIENQSAGTMGSAYGLYIDTATNTGGGAITTLYGIRVLDQTAGGTNIGIRSAVSSGANKYNLYLDGTAVNYVNGRIGVGLTGPGAMVHVDQASTTGAIPVLTLDQADVDQVLMKIIGSADAASADRTLVADSDYGTPGALTGWIQVAIQDDGNRVADADYYIPFYAVPT